jgi:membrane-bound metal-dependent hydrolase YbcI (DUF457 family)
MTAPTHIAFALATAVITGADTTVLGLVAGGALLPDIDHPLSAIGRVFFFLSIPLNKLFGHRGLVHSLVIWLPFTLLGFLWKPLFFIGGGAISHCIIDCLNLSGVSLLHPISEKIFVLASQKYRIKVGSRNEFILMIALGLVGWGGGYIGSRGGMRTMLQAFLGNYQMAVERYMREGPQICRMEGRLRFPDGSIREGSWLIIGTEGTGAFVPLAVYDEKEKKILHIPKNAEFLKARLKVSAQQWHTLRLTAPATLKEGIAFFNPAKQWHLAGPGDSVFGYVIYEGSVSLGDGGL